MSRSESAKSPRAKSRARKDELAALRVEPTVFNKYISTLPKEFKYIVSIARKVARLSPDKELVIRAPSDPNDKHSTKIEMVINAKNFGSGVVEPFAKKIGADLKDRIRAQRLRKVKDGEKTGPESFKQYYAPYCLANPADIRVGNDVPEDKWGAWQIILLAKGDAGVGKDVKGKAIAPKLNMVRQGFALKATLTEAFYIHAYINDAKDPTQGSFYITTSTLKEAFETKALRRPVMDEEDEEDGEVARKSIFNTTTDTTFKILGDKEFKWKLRRVVYKYNKKGENTGRVVRVFNKEKNRKENKMEKYTFNPEKVSVQNLQNLTSLNIIGKPTLKDMIRELAGRDEEKKMKPRYEAILAIIDPKKKAGATEREHMLEEFELLRAVKDQQGIETAAADKIKNKKAAKEKARKDRKKKAETKLKPVFVGGDDEEPKKKKSKKSKASEDTDEEEEPKKKKKPKAKEDTDDEETPKKKPRASGDTDEDEE